MKHLQQILKDRGYYSGAIDGIIGSLTLTGAKRFINDELFKRDWKQPKTEIVWLRLNKTFDNKIEVCGKTYEYDDRHIKFNNNINEINHFFINHLDYQEGLTYDYAFNNILNSNNSFYIIYNNNNNINRSNFQNEDTEEDENEDVGEEYNNAEEDYDEEDDREDGEDEETIEYNEQDSIS